MNKLFSKTGLISPTSHESPIREDTKKDITDLRSKNNNQGESSIAA